MLKFMSNDFLERLGLSLLKKGVKSLIKKILKEKENAENPKESAQEINKTHPWRTCGIGRHWVVEHPLTTPKGVTTRRSHCADNPKRGKKVIQDYLTKDEIYKISEKYFPTLSGPPASGKLKDFSERGKGDQYDFYIRGWVKYWNEVLNPDEPLDADLLKALIASESSFNPHPMPQNAGTAGQAYGLIQLTDQAIKALRDPNGELKDHLIEMMKEDASDPNVSICAGTRWLHQKKKLASHKLKRQATWDEGIAEYKGYLSDMISGKNNSPEGMKRIHKLYEEQKK